MAVRRRAPGLYEVVLQDHDDVYAPASKPMLNVSLVDGIVFLRLERRRETHELAVSNYETREIGVHLSELLAALLALKDAHDGEEAL